jgi:hypothetical protein
MNTVYVLIALVYSGHLTYSIVPTMEFTTQQRCEAAIAVFEQESQGKTGSARMRCVRIEK